MKKADSFFLPCGFAACLFVVLTGCGLRYMPGATAESIEEERRFAMQEQLFNDYKTIGKHYKPLTYGELTVVKPDSYRRLDSLYAIKYRNSHRTMPELEEQIEVQKAIIDNDTNRILYVETHWFELSQDSTYEFFISEISLTKDHRIYDVRNLESFRTEKQYVRFAELFMKEESLLNGEFGLRSDEMTFYSFYKTRAAALSGLEKDRFMAHTFDLMRTAEAIGTLSTEALLRVRTLETIHRKYPMLDLANLKVGVQEIVDTEGGKNEFMYYSVSVLNTKADANEAPFVYRYDAYLQPWSEQ